MIYENIKAMCKFRNIKMRDIENAAGLHTGYISRMKHRQKDMPISVLISAARMLNVSIDNLVFNDIAKDIKRDKLLDEIDRLKIELSILDEELE